MWEKEEVHKVLDRGMFQPRQSRWVSHLVLITKKDETTYFALLCVLSDAQWDDSEGCLSTFSYWQSFGALRASKYICTLDLFSDLWNVEMDHRGIEITEFCHPVFLSPVYGPDICALLDHLTMVLTKIRDKLSDVSHFAVSGTCSDINRCTSRPIEKTESSQE